MQQRPETDLERSLLADVVAFTALPATWVGATPAQVAESLADALHRALQTEALAVVLRDERAGPVIARRGDDALLQEAVEAAREGHPIPAPVGAVGVGPVGVRGCILAAWNPSEPPGRAQRMLLVLAANQADTALREAAADHQIASVQQQLVKLEKLAALGQVVSGVAHEIRTPVTYASTNLSIARARLAAWKADPTRPMPEVDSLLEETQDALDRVNALVVEMRRFFVPGASRRREEPLSQAVAQALRLFRATSVSPVTVTESLDAEGIIDADPVQIQQVTLNVLQNAVEAMPKGGHVAIATRDEDDAVVLVLEDDGPGIPETIQGRVFDPFFTTKAEGSGLGLAIVRRIVENHKGTMTLQSGQQGTRFTFRFPRVGPR